MCLDQGHVTAATTVDHIKPHKGDWSLFSDPANLQSLCPSHHSSTKQREEAVGHAIGCDDAGLPLDPDHPWHL
jgi:5-methylcytosine-specific restriction enzyme A